MSLVQESTTLLALAEEVFGQTYLLNRYLIQNSIAEPSLAVGAKTELWTSRAADLEDMKNNIFGLTKKLNKLLHGPQSFLHEYVSTNWEYGALYTVLEMGVLEAIPLDGKKSVKELAGKAGIPEAKMLAVLRLVACEDILFEVEDKMFCHTAVSEELVTNQNFKSFIGFQLFETRVASAHLADSLKKSKPNDFHAGQSAFKYAWGNTMYEWHKLHPEKGARFGQAMQGVSASLDPGNKLFLDWFQSHPATEQNIVVDVRGKDGGLSKSLADKFPTLRFEVQDASQVLLSRGKDTLTLALKDRITFQQRQDFLPQDINTADKVFAYAIRNVLWNMSDNDCISLLQTFTAALQKSPGSVLLVNELLSPIRGSFESHIEQAYRRRDVTLMTMHNVKQRTEDEWMELLTKAMPGFEITITKGFTSHTSKGLCEIRWIGSNGYVHVGKEALGDSK